MSEKRFEELKEKIKVRAEAIEELSEKQSELQSWSKENPLPKEYSADWVDQYTRNQRKLQEVNQRLASLRVNRRSLETMLKNEERRHKEMLKARAEAKRRLWEKMHRDEEDRKQGVIRNEAQEKVNEVLMDLVKIRSQEDCERVRAALMKLNEPEMIEYIRVSGSRNGVRSGVERARLDLSEWVAVYPLQTPS